MDLRRLWEQLPPVTRNLVAINLIVWLADAVLARIGLIDLTSWFGLFSLRYSAFHGAGSFHIWQLVTYMFMHAGFDHFFFNMFAVLMFGTVIEREWGSEKYLTYYLTCGVGAGLVQLLMWWLFYPGAAVTVGASGAVFGILLAFAWLFPEQKMFLLFVPIPISSRVFVGLYALVELFSGVAHFQGDSVAHFAHLGGMLFGYLLIKYWQEKNNKKNGGGRFKIYEGKDYSNYHYKDSIR